MVLNSDSQGLPNVFSWELNISKFLVVLEVGGTNFHGFIFLWVREDEIFVNFKLGANHKQRLLRGGGRGSPHKADLLHKHYYLVN